jgi:hypothetical protein
MTRWSTATLVNFVFGLERPVLFPGLLTVENPKTTPTEGYSWAAGFPQFRRAISQ